MAKITYENKVALNVNSDIADINKVNASDLNEIKGVVNTNDDNMGLLSNLNTTNKSNLVEALNETNTNSKNMGMYFSEETIIGTWFGKPLYRKTITFKTTISGSFTVPHEIANVDEINVDYGNSYFKETTGISYSLPIIGYAGNFTDNCYAYVNKENIYIFATGGWNTSWTKYITLLYTKTTD
jgi:hypothetical protein